MIFVKTDIDQLLEETRELKDTIVLDSFEIDQLLEKTADW